MPKPKNLIPTEKLHVALSLPLHQRMTAHLWSEAESRVPHGAYQAFLEQRIREYFGQRTIDIAPFVVGMPAATFHITGTAESLEQLINALKGKS